MTRTQLRSGEGRLGCVLWLSLLVGLIVVAWGAVPVTIHSAELYDYMDEQAKFAGRVTPEVLKKRILKRAVELELPVKEKDIKVERVGGRIRMKCSYTVHLESPHFILTTEPPFVTQTWKFDLKVDRPVFIV